MPKVKCPSCGTVVTHAVGYDPICPKCGFGGPAQPAARRIGSATPIFSEPPDDRAASAQPENGLAIGALVCGIVGFLVGITAPIAVILGIIALNRPVDASGRSMAIVGIVLGAIVTIGYLLIFLFFAALIGALAS